MWDKFRDSGDQNKPREVLRGGDEGGGGGGGGVGIVGGGYLGGTMLGILGVVGGRRV